MPECIVCKGYYEAEQRCIEIGRLRKEADQCNREMEKRHRRLESRHREMVRFRDFASSAKRVYPGLGDIISSIEHAFFPGLQRRHRMAERTHRAAESRSQETEEAYQEAERLHGVASFRCKRCDSDNRIWENFRAFEPIEQGGWAGIAAFTQPHIYLPLIVTALVTLLGLLSTFTLWDSIKPFFRALALLITPIGCLLTLQAAYVARKSIRENESLRRVKRGWHKGIGIKLKTLLLPAVAVGIALILTWALMSVEALWELVRWLALSKVPETGGNIIEKFLAVLPVTSLMGYVLLAISFTGASSLMLAWRYMNRLNEFLPLPIFLQDDKLARVVRREAETELGRLDPLVLNPDGSNDAWMGYLQLEEQATLHHLLPDGIGVSGAAEGPSFPQREVWVQAGGWVWDELARTDGGGVEMKVARQEMYKLPHETRKGGHDPGPRVRYIVSADPWGRVTDVRRAGDG